MKLIVMFNIAALSMFLTAEAESVEPKPAPPPLGNVRDRNGSEVRRMNDLETELKKCEGRQTKDQCMDRARRRQNGM